MMKVKLTVIFTVVAMIFAWVVGPYMEAPTSMLLKDRTIFNIIETLSNAFHMLLVIGAMYCLALLVESFNKLIQFLLECVPGFDTRHKNKSDQD